MKFFKNLCKKNQTKTQPRSSLKILKIEILRFCTFPSWFPSSPSWRTLFVMEEGKYSFVHVTS